MYIALGRIQIPRGASLLPFLGYGLLAYLQALTARGNMHASIYWENPHTFWSMSAWHSRQAMQDFRNAGSHARAMKLSQHYHAPVDFRVWYAQEIPNWNEAMLHLTQPARLAPSR